MKEDRTATLNTQTSVQTETSRRPKKHGLVSPIVADTIAGLSSLVAGAVTARQQIAHHAHENIKSLSFIKDIEQARTAAGQMLASSVDNGVLESQEAYGILQGKIRSYDTRIAQRLEKAGIKGILQEVGLLRNRQKIEIAITTIAAGGIALGAMFLLSRGLLTSAQQDELEAKSQPTAVRSH